MNPKTELNFDQLGMKALAEDMRSEHERLVETQALLQETDAMVLQEMSGKSKSRFAERAATIDKRFSALAERFLELASFVDEAGRSAKELDIALADTIEG